MLEDFIEVADDLMRSGDPRAAMSAYQRVWEDHAGELGSHEHVWLLLSIGNAAVRAGDFDEAFGALSALPEYYGESGIVVGNPLFHLLVGLTLHGFGDDPAGVEDNFARALICGGEAIFAGEDGAHLDAIERVLRPPADTGTWAGYEGAARGLLDGAPGYLRELITQKLGAAPPYRSEGA